MDENYLKGAYSVRNFKKWIFSIIFYIKVEHLERFVSSFQGDWRKINDSVWVEEKKFYQGFMVIENFKGVYLRNSFSKSLDAIS